MNTFSEDLRFGKKMERLSLNYINNYSQIVVAPDRKFSAYDYKVVHTDNPEKWVRYEVKADRQAYRTGNFFIETHSKTGTASGLLTTRSDYYLLMVIDIRGEIDDVYCIETSIIKNFYNEGKHKFRSFSGMSSCANGFLLPRTELDNITVIG